MRTLYFGHTDLIGQRFPDLHSVADAELVAALSPYYRLYEAEARGKFYLIFDYSPTLPTQEEAIAALAPEILARTFAAVEFDRPEEREKELAEVRRSLWDEGDDNSVGVSVGRPTPPPWRVGMNARGLGEQYPRDWE